MDIEMKILNKYSSVRPLLAAAVLSALAAGCGGGSTDSLVPNATALHGHRVPVGGGTGGSVAGKALAPVNLGAAGSFALLTKSGITDVYASAITGDVGSSPITGAAILLTCSEVSGTINSVDAAGP